MGATVPADAPALSVDVRSIGELVRYLILSAAVLIQLCLGGLYAWSNFVPALMADHGLTAAQTQLVFGCLIAVFTTAMVFAGRMLQRRGPKIVAIIGGTLFGAGYLIASFSDGSFPLLFLGIAVVAGVGTGFGYVCPLATGMAWFPEHKGLVTGVAVGGFGAGAVLLSAVTESLFARGMDVLEVFRWIGMTYGAVIVLAALIMRFPPERVDSVVRPTPAFGTLVRDPFFLAMALGIFSGTFAGLMVIGNLQLLALSSGVSTGVAAVAVSMFAVGNASGRIAWGWVSDRLGDRTVVASLGALAVMLGLLGLLGPMVGTPVGTVAVAGLVGFTFGACFIVYAARVAARYGADRIGGVYPLVFLAYGAAGILGPWLGGHLYDATGSYGLPIAISIAVVLVGLVGSTVLLRRSGAFDPPARDTVPAAAA